MNKRRYLVIGGIVLGFAVIAFAAAVVFPAVRDALIYDTVTYSVSPWGEKKVALKVDYVSRPYVFYGNKCIFEYDETYSIFKDYEDRKAEEEIEEIKSKVLVKDRHLFFK